MTPLVGLPDSPNSLHLSVTYPSRPRGSAMQGETHLPGQLVVGKGGDLLQAITQSPPSHRPPPSQRESHPEGENQIWALRRQRGNWRKKNFPVVRCSLTGQKGMEGQDVG